MTGSLAMDVTSAPPETLHLLPVDKVLILIALHLILNGGLQVPNALECQLEVSLQALVSSFQTLQVHLLGGGSSVQEGHTVCPLASLQEPAASYSLPGRSYPGCYSRSPKASLFKGYEAGWVVGFT